MKRLVMPMFRGFSLLLVVIMFLLNVNLEVAGLKIDTTTKAQAFMFGEAKCFGGQLGGDSFYPKCEQGCPYEFWSVFMELGTCNNDPIIE